MTLMGVLTSVRALGEPAFRTEDAEAVALVPHLTAPLPSYVSLQTALYHHGMISQIPSVVYAVSLSRTRRFATAVAEFSVHHVAPGWFFGYEALGERRIPMAVPEKALVDVLYLSPTRSRIFSALPEVELPKGFGIRAARRMVDRIPDARRREMVHRRLEPLL